MKTNEGQLIATGLKTHVVVSRFNAFITERLLEGYIDAFTRHGGDRDAIEVTWVPGSFEMPLVAKAIAERQKPDAVACLGCVIRGATDHYDYVCSQTAAGIAKASLETGVPIIFGVLTTNTIEQAVERAGTKAGNKGADAAMAAIETANVLKQI